MPSLTGYVAAALDFNTRQHTPQLRIITPRVVIAPGGHREMRILHCSSILEKRLWLIWVSPLEKNKKF